eukprot:scaffold245353_cov31-Tisochrysis_lutea.AAC.1
MDAYISVNIVCWQEVANELDKRSHLVATTPTGLLDALREMPLRAQSLQPWPASDATAFSRYLDGALGLE